MSTFKYAHACELFATAGLSWTGADIKAMLVTGNYTPLRATHRFVSDIPIDDIVIRTDSLANLSATGGICRGDIPELSAFLASSTVAALVLYADSGDDTTSVLIYYSSDGIGFPFTPQGFNYFGSFDQANGGFFQV